MQSMKRTGRPIGLPSSWSSCITTWPRTTVAIGQPVTCMPSNGVQPHLLTIQEFSIRRLALRSTRVRSPSYPSAMRPLPEMS